jgi:hypothetical protein
LGCPEACKKYLEELLAQKIEKFREDGISRLPER